MSLIEKISNQKSSLSLFKTDNGFEVSHRINGRVSESHVFDKLVDALLCFNRLARHF